MADQPASLWAREPIFLGHLIAAGLGYLAILALTRGWISTTQASSLTQQLAPMVTATVLALQGALMRRYVTPSMKQRAEDVEQVVLHFEQKDALPPS